MRKKKNLTQGAYIELAGRSMCYPALEWKSSIFVSYSAAIIKMSQRIRLSIPL